MTDKLLNCCLLLGVLLCKKLLKYISFSSEFPKIEQCSRKKSKFRGSAHFRGKTRNSAIRL